MSSRSISSSSNPSTPSLPSAPNSPVRFLLHSHLVPEKPLQYAWRFANDSSLLLLSLTHPVLRKHDRSILHASFHHRLRPPSEGEVHADPAQHGARLRGRHSPYSFCFSSTVECADMMKALYPSFEALFHSFVCSNTSPNATTILHKHLLERPFDPPA